MKIVKVYHGAGNTAIIEKHTGRPAFKGDKVKADLYRVIFAADHDHGFIYHCTCFESLKDAENHINEYKFFKEAKNENI